jgi:hypothetical protein
LTFCVLMVAAVRATGLAADRPLRLKATVENLLVRAKAAGNLELELS